MSGFGNSNGELPFEFRPKVYTVSEIISKADELLRTNFFSVVVEGEVAEPRLYEASGHFYFALKDNSAKLPCVMFKRQRHLIGGYTPQEGELVQARGTLSIYARTGSFQLIVDYMELAGEGALRAEFERLKRKLQAEGLFDEAHKQPLPAMPSVIGIVTSLEGAVLHDLVKVIRNRFPPVKIVVSPSKVQGEDAPIQLIAALKRLERIEEIDVIILARGGGSAEDLAAFNDEALARAIFACKKPVISAVGHEVDFTIADFVADVRASTPSNAGELVVPQAINIEQQFKGLARRIAELMRLRTQKVESELNRAKEVLVSNTVRKLDYASFQFDQDFMHSAHALQNQLEARKNRFERLYSNLLQYSPQHVLMRQSNRLHELRRRLLNSFDNAYHMRSRAFEQARTRIESMNPRRVLKRGYSVAIGPNGKAVKDAAVLSKGDRLKLVFYRGEADTEVLSTHNDEQPT